MKKVIKKILKKFISQNFIDKYFYCTNKIYKSNKLINKIKFIFFDNFFIKKVDVYKFSNIYKYLKGKIKYTKYFAYLVNFKCFVSGYGKFNDNMTPDYNVILENSLNEIKNFYKDNKKQLIFLNELEKYLDLYIEEIEKSTFKNKKNVINTLNNIKNKKCKSFEESLQRILFFNQIFWQMGYSLCGLGRLDYILDKYYQIDIKNKKITKFKAQDLIVDFLTTLNYHYSNKSSLLNGDTGQIIIIGGIDENGINVDNDLTHLFLIALKEFNKPDPKLFLRVNYNTNNELLKIAIECMATGIGSPLLSNDDIIIPKLIKFGYEKNDVWNYVTAACWEPSPCGNSIDLNNSNVLDLLKPFNKLFDNNINLNKKNLLDKYFEELEIYIKDKILELKDFKFGEQPYLSFFIKNCRETGTFITDEKVKYKNFGITTLGISSVVNSIININKFVFNDKLWTLKEFNEFRINNFQDDNVLKVIKNNNKNGYGSSNNEAIELTNQITNFISKEFDKYSNYYGGKYKFGLSAPSYVEVGNGNIASFDGRKNSEALNVHISSMSNSYIDIMDFASKITYQKNGINGNVIDFILSPSYINNNLEKFTNYIYTYIKKGFYQMQINVIDSDTLIKAKENPDLYRNLIVRVWGFSAYFNELPEEYKDLLIKRAQESERINN